MATDCDVSNPGPGPPTTSGCERWVCRFRQGWTSALGLGRWAAGRPACGRILAPLLASSLKSSALARAAPPPPEDRRLLELPELAFYFSHSILLPENSTSLSSAERRCSLVVPFFKSNLLAGGLALAAVSDLAVCP